jgi:hypothetical protein
MAAALDTRRFPGGQEADLTDFGAVRNADSDPLRTEGNQFANRALHHHWIRQIHEVHSQ